MYQNDTEMLFPPRVIPALRTLRGVCWQELADRASQACEGHIDELAFSLMMIRLDGCLNCHADSYRAMRGCTTCAQQAVMRFKGTDEDLLQRFEMARKEIDCFLADGTPVND